MIQYILLTYNAYKGRRYIFIYIIYVSHVLLKLQKKFFLIIPRNYSLSFKNNKLNKKLLHMSDLRVTPLYIQV